MTITVDNYLAWNAITSTDIISSISHAIVADVAKLVVVVSILDSSSSDGVVYEVFANINSVWKYFACDAGPYYDAVTDGHLSIWSLDSPEEDASMNISARATGSCTDLMASSLQLKADGNIAVDSYGSGTSGTEPTNQMQDVVNVQNSGAILVAAGMNDEATGSKITLDDGTSLHIEDLGNDTGTAAYRMSPGTGNQSIAWSNSDDDQTWDALGVAYYEVPTFTPQAILIT